MVEFPARWGKVPARPCPTSASPRKIGREIGHQRIWHAPCEAGGTSKGRCPQPRGKTKMDSETTNLFRRRDTFFGICEAVGQDFGFNPLWLRLDFIADRKSKRLNSSQ